MARLVAMIANRPDLASRVAAFEKRGLAARNSADEAWGWGVGFYQSGEVLLKRRPIDERRDVSLVDMLADVRSDVLVAHVRRATVGALATANTHPFRYGHFMFADTGTVDGFIQLREKLFESLPRFLQRHVRGETDAELVFHLFLSFLHDAGRLDDPHIEAADCLPALRSALGLLDRMSRDEGVAESRLNVVLATSEYLVAIHRGEPMAYRVYRGREDFEPMFEERGPGKLRMPDLEPCRLAIVASDFENGEVPDGWTAMPAHAMVTLTRTDEPLLVSPS